MSARTSLHRRLIRKPYRLTATPRELAAARREILLEKDPWPWRALDDVRLARVDRKGQTP